ncbi:methyl-accepting chemotaxis protein/Na+-transporting NADH:ubiquinone oxidoreductase subunit NqrC [Anoxybacillus tepidamans]|uniref:Methyl-accepting chemotaxis protein/Na+-transporting NADH:ubiquinone oxidoreductase subunit NqrC n=1 Tax=Anoxybacteroides tepidamans TaxID=265948 RepID=A0A7W8IT67_9BACL|nr:methyl-accepting chemotaxis protein [Anoxybacillus tepidamans]MBB5325284.1 methyl-accepting chemotaxis protein/Na+-transporting NADH:ubiquinone oxidoreductase subunit NqrC [Anoxybacillus tepidamans]
MKKNTVIQQIFMQITILLFLKAVLLSSAFYFLAKKQLEKAVYNEIKQTSQIIKEAMVTADDSQQTIERLIDQKLLSASKEIAKQLKGKNIDDITRQELVRLKNEVGVYDISLFVKKGDDIVVAQSSDLNEVGLSSKNWGYWFTAFQQLMAGKEVTVGKGYYVKNFWSGPISKSEWEDKYYKYAYYYDGTTSFMINPYILDQEIYRLTHDHGPAELIKKIIRSQDEIVEIAVINVPAWLKGKKNKVVEPQRDLPVLFGRHTFLLSEDRDFFKKALNKNEILSVQFSKNDVSYAKFYVPIENNRVLAIVANYSQGMYVYYKLMFIFISSLIVSTILIFIILKNVTKNHLKPLTAITQHIQSISKGHLSTSLHIFTKNEWGLIAQYLNDMTRNISGLIVEVKKEIESLVSLSALLNETMDTSLKTIDELSSSITADSEKIFHEIDMYSGKLAHYSNQILGMIESIKSDFHEKEQLVALLHEMTATLYSFRTFTKQYVSLITNMNLLSYQTVQDVDLVIDKLTKLSQELEERIKVFQLEQ